MLRNAPGLARSILAYQTASRPGLPNPRTAASGDSSILPGVHPLQGGEGEEELLDASLALEGNDNLVVEPGGLAGDDDALAELGVADVIAGGEGLSRSRPLP